MSDDFPACWLAKWGRGPCYGRLVKAHLIPQQTLRKEIAYLTPEITWDERAWVWACGGIMGNASHHGQFDAGKIIIPRQDLPIGLLEFAAEHGLMWYVDKHFPDPEAIWCQPTCSE